MGHVPGDEEILLHMIVVLQRNTHNSVGMVRKKFHHLVISSLIPIFLIV